MFNVYKTVNYEDTAKEVPAKLKTSLLGVINAKRQVQLTPNCKKLFLSSIKLSKKLSRCSKKVKTFKSKARMARKFSKDDSLIQLFNKVDKTTYGFIMSQVKNQSKKVQGRRFTLDDKILALSIYKQSPKAYRYLSTIFSLPC